MSLGPNSIVRIGTSDNSHVLKTTGPEAVSLYCMVLHATEYNLILLYGFACYYIVLYGIVWCCTVNIAPRRSIAFYLHETKTSALYQKHEFALYSTFDLLVEWWSFLIPSAMYLVSSEL